MGWKPFQKRFFPPTQAFGSSAGMDKEMLILLLLLHPFSCSHCAQHPPLASPFSQHHRILLQELGQTGAVLGSWPSLDTPMHPLPILPWWLRAVPALLGFVPCSVGVQVPPKAHQSRVREGGDMTFPAGPHSRSMPRLHLPPSNHGPLQDPSKSFLTYPQ